MFFESEVAKLTYAIIIDLSYIYIYIWWWDGLDVLPDMECFDDGS